MSESDEATGDDTGDFDIERVADLAERIGDRVTAMKRAIVDDDEADGVLIELAEDLWELLDELEDVLATIDFEELPEAIDFEELPETIDAEDIPEGLVSEDETAIDLGDVRQAVHLRELWDAVDLTQLVEEKRELDSAVDDVQDDFDDEGEAEETGGEEGEEDDGLLEGDLIGNDEEDLIETDLVGGGGEDDEGLIEGDLIGDDDDEEDDEFFQNVVGTEGAHVQFDAEARQAYLEEVIQEAVAEFRSMLLWTHDKLRRLYKANQEKLGQPGRQPDSLNPTATSTLPPGPEPDSASTRASTVPAQVRYSKVENPRRIYGRRFTDAMEDRNDSEEESDPAEESEKSEESEEAPVIEQREETDTGTSADRADAKTEVDR